MVSFIWFVTKVAQTLQLFFFSFNRGKVICGLEKGLVVFRLFCGAGSVSWDVFGLNVVGEICF